MTGQQKSPVGLEGPDAGGKLNQPDYTRQFSPFNADGFNCSFCGDWFRWSDVGGFGNGFRFCDDCADILERIHGSVDQ